MFVLAHDLADAIAEGEVFAAFQEAEIDLLNDDVCQRLLGRSEQLRDRLMRGEYASVEAARKLAIAVQRLDAMLKVNPIYDRYERARRQFDAYVSAVLDEISTAISGTLRSELPCGGAGQVPDAWRSERPFRLAADIAVRIMASEEYRRLAAAEQRFLRDDDVRQNIAHLRRLEEQLQQSQDAELRRQLEKVKAEIAAEASYQYYQLCRQNLDRLVGAVLDAISVSFSGGQRPASGCGSSGGNCNCGSGLNLPPAPRIERLITQAG